MKFMAKTNDGEYHELKDLNECETITIDEQAFKNMSFEWGDSTYVKEPIRNGEIGHIDGLCTPEIEEMFTEQVKPENAVVFKYDENLVSEQYEQDISVHDSTWFFFEEAIYKCCLKIAEKVGNGKTVKLNYKIDCTKERCVLPHDQRPIYSEYTVTVYWCVE